MCWFTSKKLNKQVARRKVRVGSVIADQWIKGILNHSSGSSRDLKGVGIYGFLSQTAPHTGLASLQLFSNPVKAKSGYDWCHLMAMVLLEWCNELVLHKQLVNIVPMQSIWRDLSAWRALDFIIFLLHFTKLSPLTTHHP